MRAVVRAFASDILNSKFSDACSLMTQQGQAQVGGGDATRCTARLALARAIIAGSQLDQLKAAASGTPAPAVTITGDHATVPNTTGNGTASLFYSGGRWLIGPGSSAGGGTSGGAVSSTPSAATVKQWPTKWCQAQPGMTRAQLYAVMGPPTDDITTGTNPQASWSAFDYQFNAFFGVDGKVRQLDINDIQLSAGEKAALACATTRVAP